MGAVELATGKPPEALVRLAVRKRDPTSARSAAPQHLLMAAVGLRTWVSR